MLQPIVAPNYLENVYGNGQQHALPDIDFAIQSQTVRVKNRSAYDGLGHVVGESHSACLCNHSGNFLKGSFLIQQHNEIDIHKCHGRTANKHTGEN